jgi:alkylation response protein AidB-like acyl-CoA dehydrogenase
MVRTGVPEAKGISCLLAPAGTPGLNPAAPERKMGMRSSHTASIVLDGARVPPTGCWVKRARASGSP